MENLGADSPITDRSADALNYWPFAEALAKGLVSRVPADGFVVGLQGQWGMGKTSAMNLLVQAISQFEGSKGPYQKTRIQRYNPWLFAGLEALAKGYLSNLAGLSRTQSATLLRAKQLNLLNGS